MGSAWFLGLFNRGTTDFGPPLTPVAKFDHPKMEEVSGLVASARYPDVLWAHNDSGNEPRLFALTPKGEIVAPEGADKPFPGIDVKNATLRDWEAIARNGEQLLICELGNNLNAGRKLGVYLLDEPDPHSATEVPARFLKLTYPDQTGFPPTDRWHFDSEAAFCWDRRLYILTKNRPAFRIYVQQDSTNLYSVDLREAGESAVLTRVDSASGLGGWVTGADISPDGRWVAILCESPQQCIWLFERPDRGEKLLSEAKSRRVFNFKEGGQLEAMAFHQSELILVNEERQLFRITMDQFEEVDP